MRYTEYMCMFVFPGAEPQRIVVQESKQPERIAVFMPDEPDYGTRRSRTMSLGRESVRSQSNGRAPGKV